MNGRSTSDTSFTVDRFKGIFGVRLQSAEHIALADIKDVSRIAFPEIRATQEGHLFPFLYYFKIWRCGQLIHRHVKKTGQRYDVVIRMRPDMTPLLPYHLARVEGTPGTHRLTVGDNPDQPLTCVEFGQRDYVVRTFTYRCINDQLGLGSYAAMTTMMDLPRLVTPKAGYLAYDKGLVEKFRSDEGGEMSLHILAWRTGTRIIRAVLFTEMSRVTNGFGSIRKAAWLNKGTANGSGFNNDICGRIIRGARFAGIHNDEQGARSYNKLPASGETCYRRLNNSGPRMPTQVRLRQEAHN